MRGAGDAAFGAPDGVGNGRAAAQVDGRTVHLELCGPGDPGFAGTATAVVVTVPLPADRPVRFRLRPRKAAAGRRIRGEVRTGDPAFDRAFLVTGTPHEVVLAALDGPTRAWILDMRPPASVTLDPGQLRVTWNESPTAEVLEGCRTQLAMADALVRAYDECLARHRTYRGERAADRWNAENRVARGETVDRAQVRNVLAALATLAAGLLWLTILLARC